MSKFFTRILVVLGLAVISVALLTRHYEEREADTADSVESRMNAESATPPPTSEVKSETRWVTMDGTENGELMVPIINLWKDYNNRSRGVAGTIRHGARVKLIRRSGNGVLVETKSGTRGWATYYFVREFQ